MTHLLDDLAWRGLMSQTTGGDELRAATCSESLTPYCDFEPTAPSLHIGK